MVGRPIVTTDVPGCRDVIGAGGFGVLVPARDAHALTHAVLELLENPARMGLEARASAERFSSIRVVQQTLRV